MEKRENRPDLRVRRTQKMLRDALIAVVIEKGFDVATVQMLADHAMINRATFYRHYTDKYDLAEKVYAGMSAEYAQMIRSAQPKSPDEVWPLLFRHVAEHADFFNAMLRTMPQFQNWVLRSIEEELRIIFFQMGGREEDLDLPLELILRYIGTAQIGVVQWWLSSGMTVSIEEMGQHLKQLHLYGGFSALNFVEDVE